MRASRAAFYVKYESQACWSGRRLSCGSENMIKIKNERHPACIFTHHKCATRWTADYVDEFCRKSSLSLFYSHFYDQPSVDDADVYLNTNANYSIESQRFQHALHIVRNPLDIVVSAYYSHKGAHSEEGWTALSPQRKLLIASSKSYGMSHTLAFLCEPGGPLSALKHWNYSDARFVTLKMEDMVADPDGTIGAFLKRHYGHGELPSAEDYTFEAKARAQIEGFDSASHYRSGRRNQWRKELPPQVIQYIMAHFEPMLKQYYPEVFSRPAAKHRAVVNGSSA